MDLRDSSVAGLKMTYWITKKMNEAIKSSPKIVRAFFFWSGIIATLSYRIIIVLNFYSPIWVKVFWYIGTIGFIFYFGHRYQIQKKRAELVKNLELIKEVENLQINSEKKNALSYIVKTTLTSKSQHNSLFIFALSIIALMVGIGLDVFD